MADLHFDLNAPFDWDEIEDGLPDLNESLFSDEYHQAEEGMEMDEEALAIDAYGDENETHGTVDTHEEDMDGNGDGSGSTNGNVRTRKYLTDDQRRAIYSALLERTASGTLNHGVTKSVALRTGVSLRVVQRIWERGQRGGGVHAVCSKRAKNCGRKRVLVDPQAIRDVPLSNRTTLQDLANALNMAKSTLFKSLKEGKFRRHTNDIKFALTEENKKAQVRFCISMLETHSLPHEPSFKSLYNIVYIDEKWFYRTKKCQKYYLALDEDKPQRTVKSKNFIEKVMFLAAIARPRFDEEGNNIFSGKIGIFPFTFTEPAKRSSVNRPAGTMITKAMTSVTKETSRDYLVNKVLPAIKQNWPHEELGMPIFIQQNNAKTHIAINDEDFCRVAKEDGFDIRLMCQPPNSPDLNVLDLGFFAAIQSLFQKSSPQSVEDIVNKVTKAYEEYPTAASNRVFLTQQACMREILREKGGQHYAIPHMKKLALERIGELPRSLQCELQIVQEAMDFVN